MNAAVLLSACVAVLQVGIGVLLLAVSRAPAWRGARVFSVIALSAAGYGAGNIASAYFPLSDAVRVVGSRFSYGMAAVFVAAWLTHAYDDGSTSVRGLPAWVKVLAGLVLAGGALSLLTTLHLRAGEFSEIHLGWTNVRYRFATPSVLGEYISYVYLAGVFATCVACVRRRNDTGRVPTAYLIGFSIFLVAVVVEVLVSNGYLKFFFVADVGFLAVVVPAATLTVQRFVDDAQRLSTTSSQLTEEIEIRTHERDEAQHAWLEAERQAALGRLAAGVGHEVNNPLAYLRLNIELIGEWGREHDAPPDLMESVESALDGADRIRRVTDALRAYSRPGAAVLAPIAPEAFTQAALRVTAHQLREAGTIHTHFDPAPSVLADEGTLVQVMVNLLVNAGQAVVDGKGSRPGEIRVRIGTHDGWHAVIEVSDNGAGVAPEALRRLTEPFFTTRSASGAMGLGLFLSRGLIEQFGGMLQIESTIDVGTTVRILLPPADASPLVSALEPLGVRPRRVAEARSLGSAREIAVGH